MHFDKDKLTPVVTAAVVLIGFGVLLLVNSHAYTSPIPYLLVVGGLLCLLAEDAYRFLQRRRRKASPDSRALPPSGEAVEHKAVHSTVDRTDTSS
jgi:drug/metabolite transporter (DMT)-like permease